jgi:hypothetical protein
MSTWKPAYPKHKPFKCRAYWHLRASGLWIATYDLVGAVTNGGENPFFSSIMHVSRYFETDYETQRRVFKGLRSQGWFELLPDNQYRYIAHDAWAEKHPGKCNVRELLPWQIETDPLVGHLYAVTGGKLRIYENMLIGMRKLATDEEILALFKTEWQEAQNRKARGDWSGTGARSILERVRYLLKTKSEAVEQ